MLILVRALLGTHYGTLHQVMVNDTSAEAYATDRDHVAKEEAREIHGLGLFFLQ